MQERHKVWVVGLALLLLEGGSVTPVAAALTDEAPIIEFTKEAFQEVTEDPSPNVVLVTIDTLRADYLSAYGGPAYTPNLNQLAKKGWLFKNCYSTSMLTNPSHASIMTSLFPKDHGVYDNQSGIQDGLPTLAMAMQRRGYRTLAVMSFPHLNQETSNLGQGFDHVIAAKRNQRDSIEAVEHALSLVDDLNYNDKFFLWVHLVDPHAPYHLSTPPHPTPEHPIDAKPMQFVRQAAPGFQKSNRWFRWAMRQFKTTRPLIKRYISEIEHADAGMGLLLDGLDRRGHGRDTAYFVTSDHGENLGEHELYFHHGGLYRETVHVPLIAYLPRHAPATIEGLVQTIDIAPTILEVTNAPKWSPMRGRALVDLAQGRALGRSFVFSEHMNAQLVSVRSADSTLIMHRKNAHQFPTYPMKKGKSEFYHTRTDPDELRPLPYQTKERATLRKQLQQFLSTSYEYRPRPAYAQDLDSLRALGYLD
jgi:arylsulfatase A-like enzyme